MKIKCWNDYNRHHYLPDQIVIDGISTLQFGEAGYSLSQPPLDLELAMGWKRPKRLAVTWASTEYVLFLVERSNLSGTALLSLNLTASCEGMIFAVIEAILWTWGYKWGQNQEMFWPYHVVLLNQRQLKLTSRLLVLWEKENLICLGHCELYNTCSQPYSQWTEYSKSSGIIFYCT